MTTALIIGGLVLLGMGLVASQLFRLKDWLKNQPPPPDQLADVDDPKDPEVPGPQ